METVGIGIDFSNICKNYNTVYLDRDNQDRETTECMNKVMHWLKQFLDQLCTAFSYKLYHLNSDTKITIEEVAAKRFLFYSLEKGITLQSFVLAEHFTPYDNAMQWASKNSKEVLLQNDEEGEGISFFVQKDSQVHRWLLQKLQHFTLEEAELTS